jgi:hypothetical protein
MTVNWCQSRVSMASLMIRPGSFCLVELRGLEPLTPCLQSDVFVCRDSADLVRQLSVSSRDVPLVTVANGTLMVPAILLRWSAHG